MWSAELASMGVKLLQRDSDESDPEEGDSAKKELFAAWALFISIMLLIIAFFTSYLVQMKKVTAIHETVISIFAGMIVGLVLLITSGDSIRNLISFDYQIFFNLLLPPIILSSGYELHQANFFRNIGTILTFAFAGTFLSAIVIGLILWLFSWVPGSLDISFIDAISVGATLSATDPVTILAIFNTYKVDPKLYTIIFGESILNDAIAIVIFETAQKYNKGEAGSLGFISFFEGTGIFLLVFFCSMLIGFLVGVATALLLKFTYLRRFPKIESCLIILIAYATYFFSHGLHMSGIVSLLFCGITLKHYAYFNMSRRTQLTTKFFFQILAQLSENFIFIYLGLALFTDNALVFQPPLIIVTILAVCAARWVAVFPLSRAINWFHRYRARRRGLEVGDELPYNYQAMLYWAGLRGAVGVALAALLTGENSYALRATVLVVVVLTVIIFGGTTARMLEILGIRTGVVEEIDSDDEFDIESFGGGIQVKRSGTGIGFNPRRNGSVALNSLEVGEGASYVSGASSPHTGTRPSSKSRKNSMKHPDEFERSDLLRANTDDSDIGSDIDTSDLPPPARRSPLPRASTSPMPQTNNSTFTSSGEASAPTLTASSAIRQLWAADDPASVFHQLDEDFIKPRLLLHGDGARASASGNGNGNGGSS
ncbi:Sodium/hydrogen exchanger family-domain-containing protein [Ilyonectria robusta]|uniref:Sodium/hydrogen exchanger family-domain-containing protein n=1 Tax=Ilyonectria robusta TaxID=1079257 RepID=UPI001E8D6650|nr:Sodium/hydrogen exchanger family-domain-containing protein [Ilyonectria robusta]KAH6984935.1 Sodium/hydrogen exchanger family-domain-containing protein [Ilyonectria sp. MPI-CAGE-AT-0026]KAH8686815.1 Sodium/hydrogen exchanger family-domain-containing protein [Ilyonectria robusta]